MMIHAAYYAHTNGLFVGDEEPKVATKKKVCFINLVRPDFYLNHNVDQIVGILIWLKKEIRRIGPCVTRCDSLHHSSEKTYLTGKNYRNEIREIMGRIFLSRASALGRWKFDELYGLNTIRILPIRYHVTHAPVEWGESQEGLLKSVTGHKQIYIKSWIPNKSHPGARYISGRYLVVNDEEFWYRIDYCYKNDSGWKIDIYPDKDQPLVDFLLNIKKLFDMGFKRKLLTDHIVECDDGATFTHGYNIAI